MAGIRGRIERLGLLARTLPRLRGRSLARVAWYRARLRFGRHPAQRLEASAPTPPFLRATGEDAADPVPVTLTLFGWQDRVLDAPPDWHAVPGEPDRRADGARPWTDSLAEVAGAGIDIKRIWEPSRFAWALPLARRAAAGEPGARVALERWIADWAAKNPPYDGPNWGCGQEAGVRVLHLLTCLRALGEAEDPAPGMRALLARHLARIEPGIAYALGQDNNHGSSEAAALFCGGLTLGDADRAAAGRRWLEDRALALILPDGASNQYSLNYHRTVLDTYAFCEIWRRTRGAPAFSDALTGAMRRATLWLWAHVDAQGGDAPNFGANDSSHLVNLAGTPYRDYRPSVQLGAVLFHGARLYPGNGPWNAQVDAFGLPLPDAVLEARRPALFAEGGTALLVAEGARAFLRVPRYAYRPAQADGLHLDLWSGSEPLLRDAGSYSYAAEDHRHFSGTGAHNTIQWDGRDQMPRLGTFLFGDWSDARVERIDENGTCGARCVKAVLETRGGIRHWRQVTLEAGHLICRDGLDGPFGEAVLRWRLPPGPGWRVAADGTVHDCARRLRIAHADGTPAHLGLAEGWESRHYLEKTPVTVVECPVPRDTALVTEFLF